MAENQEKGTETKQNGGRDTVHAAIRRKTGAGADHMAREPTLAGMWHLGVVVRHRPGHSCTSTQISDSARAILVDISHRRKPNMAG